MNWDSDGRREYQPDFDAEERASASAPRKKMARDLALNLLKKFTITAPPIDVEALAKACGLKVEYVNIAGNLSGQLYPDLEEIAVNIRNRPVQRQRFTIGHELGHWQFKHHLLDQLPPDTLGYSGAFENEGTSEGRSSIEIEANTFAAEILMPSPWIRKLPKGVKTGTPDQLAGEYRVSREAMFYQLMHCGRI